MNEVVKMDLASMDIAGEKRTEIERCLRRAFPEIFADGMIDFDQLKRVLGTWVDPGKERFGLNWPGKAECMKIIQQPSVATLKPVREESVKFDETENLFIEGDNMEVLKLLQKAYFGKVKMIYIDPPYNTGNEFIYPDKFAETLETYLAYTNQTDEQGKRFSTNAETAGRYHTRWLNMMYPRLYLARSLLTNDGVIFVSINDVEVSSLRSLLDETFGEENFIAQIVWQRSKKGDSKTIANIHEYILVYTKNKEENLASGEWRKPKPGADEVLAHYRNLSESLKGDHEAIRQHMMEWYRKMPIGDPRKSHKHYNWSDERGLYFAADFAGPDDGRKNRPRHDILHPVTGKSCQKPSTGWRWDEDKTKWALAQVPPRIHFGADETTIPNRKTYLHEIDEEPFSSVFYADGRSATLEVEELVGKGIFPFPKNREVIADLISLVCKPGDTVLDFFAGSATTGHSAFQLSAELGEKIKFILVQLPELTDKESKAYEAGFRTIADVGRARLKAAGKEMAKPMTEELALEVKRVDDLGFRTFALDRSNFRVWDGRSDKLASVSVLADELLLHVDHVRKSSSQEDLVYELLLKAGFPLTTKLVTLALAGKQVFSVQDGALLICLEREITPELIDALTEANPLQVICLDEGFKGNDQLKANAVQTFKARAQAAESEIVFRTV
jgi:adenine-specific DNA-methyltransferase